MLIRPPASGIGPQSAAFFAKSNPAAASQMPSADSMGFLRRSLQANLFALYSSIQFGVH
jgi:hypothetical protein